MFGRISLALQRQTQGWFYAEHHLTVHTHALFDLQVYLRFLRWLLTLLGNRISSDRGLVGRVVPDSEVGSKSKAAKQKH